MAVDTPRRVADLFEAVIREDPASRPEFLTKACGDDQDLWEEVSSLVREYERRGDTADPVREWGDDAERSTDFAAGENHPANRIGRYEAGRELGRGGMGIVYEAIDPILGRRIALKTFRLVGLGSPTEEAWLRARLLREARTAALLDHPNIVRVYDSGIHEELAFIAMELVEGPTLERRMRASRLESADAINILRQAAAALDYSHSVGVVHRDVKPANIMLHRGMIAKIADFGIAKIASSESPTRTTLTAGTPSYMSPEQIRRRHVDGRSDQFSLAVVAFEMFTGARPFLAESEFDLMQKIVDGDPQSVSHAAPHLPGSLDAVFQQAFAKKSGDRFPTCFEFVNALESGMSSAQPDCGDAPVPPEELPSIGSVQDVSRVADSALPADVDRAAAIPNDRKSDITGRSSSTLMTYLQQHRWKSAGTVVLLLLFLAVSIEQALHTTKTVNSRPAPTAAAPTPLNPAHVVLNQDFERLGLRTEAYLDNRQSNPNRGAASFEWRNLPSQVRGIKDVLAMAGGWGQTAVIQRDGLALIWGWEFLAEGHPFRKHPDPLPIWGNPTASFRSVSCGNIHCLALTENGTVWAWGNNEHAQLGDGTTVSRRTPVRIGGLESVMSIAASQYHSLALQQNGTVWSWGREANEGRALQRTPVQVPLLENIASISAGDSIYLALTKDGSVWIWGPDAVKLPGKGAKGAASTPILVSGISGVTAVAAGTNHVVALKSDGTVWTWGRNAYGELGDGTVTDRWTPMAVPGLDQVVAIAAGAQHSFALRHDGTVLAWGQNSYGALGDGTWKDRHVPGPVSGLIGIVGIASGGQHGLARKSDGTLWTWGWNEYGQLGRQEIRQLASTGTRSATINYERISGPNYELTGEGFPWILFDRNAHRIVLQPGNFGTSEWGAALGFDVAADGEYAISGAFQRANSNPFAGDGVDVAIFIDGDDNHPLWKKHIDTHDLAREPFSVVAQLRRGQVVRFVVFSGPQGKNGESDETSLVATIDRKEANGQRQ